MNKDNLLRMADYIETIPQEQFDMRFFRAEIIGYCTVLDPENLPRYGYGRIDFSTWSEKFTGLCVFSSDWSYLFASDWYITDDTPTGAAKRIRYYVEHGLPEDWEEQMYGVSPLSYL